MRCQRDIGASDTPLFNGASRAEMQFEAKRDEAYNAKLHAHMTDAISQNKMQRCLLN